MTSEWNHKNWSNYCFIREIQLLRAVFDILLPSNERGLSPNCLILNWHQSIKFPKISWSLDRIFQIAVRGGENRKFCWGLPDNGNLRISDFNSLNLFKAKNSFLWILSIDYIKSKLLKLKTILEHTLIYKCSGGTWFLFSKEQVLDK